MKSDDELRREFRAQHAHIAARTKRFLLLLPLIVGAVVYIREGMGVKWSNEAGLLAIIGIAVATLLFTGTRGRIHCPKCSARQTHRGFSFNLAELRSCIHCGFVMVPEVTVQKKPHNPFFDQKIRKGFTVLILIIAAVVNFLGVQGHIEHGLATGIFIALFATIPHFGIFRSHRTCPHCNSINESHVAYCHHCGEKF